MLSVFPLRKFSANKRIGFLAAVAIPLGIVWFLDLSPHPQIFLWAWERPENLLFLKDSSIGIALYAGSVELTESGLYTQRRRQPIALQAYTPVIPVIRVDNLRTDKRIDQDEIQKMSSFITEVCTFEQVKSCQIDYEPRVSEREAYKQLIALVQQSLPSHISLSTTALVSYCTQSSWLKSLDIQEIVPMFYGLGADESTIRARLADNSFTQADICEKAIGISTNDALPPTEYLREKQIYVFHPEPWNEQSVSAIISQLENL